MNKISPYLEQKQQVLAKKQERTGKPLLYDRPIIATEAAMRFMRGIAALEKLAPSSREAAQKLQEQLAKLNEIKQNLHQIALNKSALVDFKAQETRGFLVA